MRDPRIGPSWEVISGCQWLSVVVFFWESMDMVDMVGMFLLMDMGGYVLLHE